LKEPDLFLRRGVIITSPDQNALHGASDKKKAEKAILGPADGFDDRQIHETNSHLNPVPEYGEVEQAGIIS